MRQPTAVALLPLIMLLATPPAKAQMDPTLADFERAHPELHFVERRDTAGGWVFLYETEPFTVTTWLPPHVPAGRYFSDPTFGRAANGLLSTMGTVPGVARTITKVCKVYILADPVGKPQDASGWLVRKVEPSEGC